MARPKPKVEPLTSPGDHIELGLTVEVNGRRGKQWIKVGLVSQQRPDEDTEAATDRIGTFVWENLDALVAEAMSRR